MSNEINKIDIKDSNIGEGKFFFICTFGCPLVY